MPINAHVRVESDDINDALKAFKRKVEREGLIREMKKYTFYEKPTEARRRKKLKARRKQLKLLNKMRRMQG